MAHMNEIEVTKRDSTTFDVTVKGTGATTEHTVTVTPEYYQKLAGGKVPPEILVKKSFEFLLERESNTSILREFELSVISQYFPDFEKLIPLRLA